MLSAQLEFLTWLSARGVRVPQTHLWFFAGEHGEQTNVDFAHASRHCRAAAAPLDGPGRFERLQDVTRVNRYVCEKCLPALLDLPLGDAGEETMSRLRTLARVSQQIMLAGDTFHVLHAGTYPALHAAIVDQVAPYLRNACRTVGSVPSPLVDTVAGHVLDEIDELVERHRFDADAALNEGVLLAARWRCANLRQKDLFRRKPGDDYRALAALGETLSGRVTTPGCARRCAVGLLEENPDLVRRLPQLPEILAGWADDIESALTDTAPVFFVCGGLSDGVYSVPRTADAWLIAQGVRARHSVWGIGEMPAVLLEYVAHRCANNARVGNVARIDVAHQPVAPDTWSIACALWAEHKDMLRREMPLADPGQAILAAIALV